MSDTKPIDVPLRIHDLNTGTFIKHFTVIGRDMPGGFVSAAYVAYEDDAELFCRATALRAELAAATEQRDKAVAELEAAKGVIDAARKFIASEYAADNDEGVLIPESQARRVHDALCDALSSLSPNEVMKCQSCGLDAVVNDKCQQCGAMHTLASPKDHPSHDSEIGGGA